MKTNYVGISYGAKSMAYLDQERGVRYCLNHSLLLLRPTYTCKRQTRDVQ